MGVTVEILDRVDWRKLNERGIETAADIIEEITDRAVELAKEKSPYATGNNRDSITSEFNPKTLKGAMWTESGYGGYLELGTSRMGARPYMQPSAITAVKETLQ